MGGRVGRPGLPRLEGIAIGLTPTLVGSLDREQVVERVLAWLAAARSAWNAGVRGEAEQLLAAAGIVTDPAVRIELAEDLTARTLSRCVPLLDRDVEGGRGRRRGGRRRRRVGGPAGPGVTTARGPACPRATPTRSPAAPMPDPFRGRG